MSGNFLERKFLISNAHDSVRLAHRQEAVQMKTCEHRLLRGKEPATAVLVAAFIFTVMVSSAAFSMGTVPTDEMNALATEIEELERTLGPDSPETLSSKIRLGEALIDLGYFSDDKYKIEARDLLAQVVESRERILGQDHADTVSAKITLAAALHNLEDFTAERDVLVSAVESRERILGYDHEDTISSKITLAAALDSLKDYIAEVNLLLQVVEARERILGKDHPDTLIAKDELATALMHQGDSASAKINREQVLQARKRVLGPDHPDTLDSKRRLAVTLMLMGKRAEERELYSQVYEAKLRTLGPDDQDTLQSLDDLADSEYYLGNYTVARDLYTQIVEAQERLSGPDDIETIGGKKNLARTLEYLRDYKTARSLYEQTLKVEERILGPDCDSRTRDTRGRLANVQLAMGDYSAAWITYEQLLMSYEMTYGPDSPFLLYTRSMLAYSMGDLGDFHAARLMHELNLKETERLLGPGHKDILRSKFGLAFALSDLGDYSGAMELYTQILEVELQTLGPDHADTLMTKNNIAELLSALGDYKKASEIDSQILKTRDRILGPDNKRTLNSKFNLASDLFDMGEYQDAKELCEQVLRTWMRNLVPEHPDTLMTKRLLAKAINKLGDRQLAREMIEQVTETSERTLGPVHPDTLRSIIIRAEILSDLGDNAAAKELMVQVFETATRRYGTDHPLSAEAAALLGGILEKSDDPEQAVFFLKVSVEATQRSRRNLSSLEGGLRRTYLGKVEHRYRLLFDVLMKSGRTAEAMSVMDLLKEDELRELDPLLPSRDGEDGQADAPSLFSGTSDQAAYREISRVTVTQSALGAEHAFLVEKRAKGGLSDGEERRFAELDVLIGQSRAAFIEICDRLPELMEGEAGIVAARELDSLQARQETLRRMGEGTVLLHAVSTEEKLYLVLVTPYAIVTKESGIGRTDLAALVTEFRTVLQDPSRDPRQTAGRLYDVVVRPLEDELQGAGTRIIMLSLDGVLRYVPFAALYDGEKWLAERYPTSIHTEAAADKLHAGRPEGPVTARAFGVTAEYPGFPALSAVPQEIYGIVRNAGKDSTVQNAGVIDGEARLDSEFTRDALSMGLASGAPVVHLASHFRLDPQSHENTVLLLGDGNTLSLREIRLDPSLVFRGLDLLTLSACDTATGSRRGKGSEVESFGMVVQRLGASAVLASLRAHQARPR